MKTTLVLLVLFAAQIAAAAEPLYLEWTATSSESTSDVFGVSNNSLRCGDLDRPATCELTVTNAVRRGNPCELLLSADTYRVADRTLRVTRQIGKVTIEALNPNAVVHYRYVLGLSTWSPGVGSMRIFMIDEAKGFATWEPVMGKTGKTEPVRVFAQSTPGQTGPEQMNVELGCSLLRVMAVKRNPN
jgi:hypothetical protein